MTDDDIRREVARDSAHAALVAANETARDVLCLRHVRQDAGRFYFGINFRDEPRPCLWAEASWQPLASRLPTLIWVERLEVDPRKIPAEEFLVCVRSFTRYTLEKLIGQPEFVCILPIEGQLWLMAWKRREAPCTD